MSASETIQSSTVLFVFNGQDEALCRCCQTLGDAGVQVYYVPDVYSAMAQLAQGRLPSHVVVDIRLLDEHEMSFLTLGPRYFPGLGILVPLLNGTAERTASHAGNIDALPLEDLTDAVLGILPAVTATLPDDEDVVEWTGEEQTDSAGPPPAQPALEDPGTTTEAEPPSLVPETVETADAPMPPLSTDVGAKGPDTAPAMHEVVRQRMAGDQTARVPRTPPPAPPSWQEPCTSPTREAPTPPSSTVSPEEISALLGDGRVDDGDATGLSQPEHDTRSKG